MKIFLANAPWSKPGFYGVRAGSRWPHFEDDTSKYMPFPFFLAYSAAMLRDEGFTPMLVDAVAEGIDEDAFFARMVAFQPDVVLFEVSSASLNADLATLDRTRVELGDEVKVVFVGAHHDLGTPEFLDKLPKLDFTLSGEYEFPLLSLMRSLRDDAPLDAAPGLTWRNGDGTAATTPKGPPQQDVDAFPWPARDLLPMEKYNDRPGGIPEPSLQLIASRGCPFGCVFCAWPQLMYGGNSYRARSSKDVVDEIEAAVKEFGFKSFYFDDDTFNVGKKRILELCREIKERNLGLPWAIMARADQMDRELLEALKGAGLTALKYGVESGSQDVLKAACKGLDLDKVKESVRITRELGIHYHLTFMFGLPGETDATARQTIDLALELDADSAQFSVATPWPGSRFYDHLLEKGHLLSENFDEYDGYHSAVVRTDALRPEELIGWRNTAEAEWQAHCKQRQFRKTA